MPSLDVTRVLSNPRFQTTFTVTRTTQTTGADGNATDGTPTVTSGVCGVVEPDRGRAFQRLQAGSRITDAIRIYTTFRLTAGGAQGEADQITWNGAHYVVVSVMDWSQYGAGYVAAVCDLTDLN